MKKIFLLTIGILGIGCISFAQDIRIIKVNSGPRGCNKIEEKFVDETHLLICQEKGWQKCELSMGEDVKEKNKMINKITKKIIKKISKSILSEEFYYQGRKVVYEAEDKFNYKVTIYEKE